MPPERCSTILQIMCAASCDVTAAIRKLQVIARRVNYAPPGEQIERDRRINAAVTEINDALGITSSAPIETW